MKGRKFPIALDGLLVEFDEAGYCPTNFCDDPEKEAKTWKENLIYELNLILDEKAAIERRAVKEFAEKLKERLCVFFEENEDNDGSIDKSLLFVDIIGVKAKNGATISIGMIDGLLKEYLK